MKSLLKNALIALALAVGSTVALLPTVAVAQTAAETVELDTAKKELEATHSRLKAKHDKHHAAPKRNKHAATKHGVRHAKMGAHPDRIKKHTKVADAKTHLKELQDEEKALDDEVKLEACTHTLAAEHQAIEDRHVAVEKNHKHNTHAKGMHAKRGDDVRSHKGKIDEHTTLAACEAQRKEYEKLHPELAELEKLEACTAKLVAEHEALDKLHVEAGKKIKLSRFATEGANDINKHLQSKKVGNLVHEKEQACEAARTDLAKHHKDLGDALKLEECTVAIHADHVKLSEAHKKIVFDKVKNPVQTDNHAKQAERIKGHQAKLSAHAKLDVCEAHRKELDKEIADLAKDVAAKK